MDVQYLTKGEAGGLVNRELSFAQALPASPGRQNDLLFEAKTADRPALDSAVRQPVSDQPKNFGCHHSGAVLFELRRQSLLVWR